MRELAITIDLDPISCYYDIHGLIQTKTYEEDPIYTKALERIFEFFQKRDIKPTLFVVGDQVGKKGVRDLLKSAVENGYELANHTYSHFYNFSILRDDEILDELKRCNDIVYERLGYKMVGFRAPGYNTNRNVLRSLISLGFLYDSSILPSPFYYFARCIIISFYKMVGKKSRSICGSLKMPFSCRVPYYTNEDVIYFPAKRDILEIPISCTGIAGLPYIGTFMMGYKEWMHRYLLKRCRSIPFLNIELHGIDFLDFRDIQDSKLLNSQFDLNLPIEKKIDRLSRIIHEYSPDNIIRLSDFRL